MYRFDVDYLDEERGIKHIPCDDGDYVLAEDALALEAKVEEERCILEMYKASERRIKELQAKAEKYGKRYHQERHENIELRAKIKKAGDILAEHQTMTAPTYLFNAIAALKQEGEQWLA